MSNIILIGGASGSIGSYLMNYFSDLGYTVYGIGRSNQNFKSPNCHYSVLDINDDEAVQKYFSDIRKNKIKIDFYIHCIGKDISIPIGLLSKTLIDETFSKELGSSMMFIKEVATLMMIQRKGLLLNYSSVVVAIANQGSCLYGMNKIVMEHFFKILDNEYYRFNVKTCSIRLPIIEETKMALKLPNGVYEELQKRKSMSLSELAAFTIKIIEDNRFFMSGEVIEI